MEESARRRRYGGHRGRASPGPLDTPVGVPPKEKYGHFGRSRSGGSSGGAKPSHAPPHPATKQRRVTGAITTVQQSRMGATEVAGPVAGLSPAL